MYLDKYLLNDLISFLFIYLPFIILYISNQTHYNHIKLTEY